MNKQVSLILVSIFIVVLLLGTISAANWDNKKQFTLDDTTSKYGKIDIYNSFFLGLGTGDKLWQAELKHNTDTCGEYCSAEKEITIYEDGALIDDIKFETINKDGSRVEQDIRSYQFYISSNGIKIPYEIGTYVKAGTYQVLLEGEKKSSRTVDWMIKSNGKWTDEWALWNGISSTGLKAWYLFDDDNWLDEKGAYNLTQKNTVSVVPGYKTNASQFNGVLENVLYSAGTGLLPPHASGTFEAWLNINDTQHNVAFSHTSEAAHSSNQFGVNVTNHLMCGIPNAGNNIEYVYSTNTITENTWFHYACTWNSTGIDIYLNGVLDATGPKLSSSYPGVIDYITIGGGGGTFANIGQSFEGEIDEATVWSVTRTADEIYSDYVGEGFVTLNSPTDNYVSPITTILFNCSGDGTGGATIVNMSLWTNQSGTFQIENTTTGLSGLSENVVFNHTLSTDGDYVWNCQVCNIDDVCKFAPSNRTVSIDLTIPELTINLPTTLEDYGAVGEDELLNWTYTDPHLGSCWYDYNGTDVDVNCTEGNATFILEKDNYNMTFYANDSVNNLNETFFNWSYKVLENSRNFSNLTYETDTQSYQVNVTSNSSLTAVTFIYGGTSYASTLSGDTYSTTITHTTNGTRELYWNFTFGGDIFSSYTSNQTVNRTEFNICNVSDYYLNTTFLNITFLDEETLVRIGGQIDTSTTEYWLGDGSITESLIYSNLTNMSEYNFCFTPNGSIMKNTRTFQYSATGYPQRKYDDSTDLTSTITHKTLYLLSSADGIYATIQVVDENGDVVLGADVTMERQFTGVWTVVGKETSDGAGAVTFWVNPDYDHRFTLEKDGCVTTSTTIRPTQTTYTATINCLGVSDEIYIAPIEGIKYFLLPASGILTTGNQNFSFQVVSSKDNIVNAKFEIVNGSGYVLDSLSSACASDGCTISKMYNVTSAQNIKGRYYVDLGDGYILLEADAHWIEVDIPERDGTFKQFWLNLRGVFDEWHEVGEDTTNTSDFNRIVFIFLFLAIGIATFNKLTHFDTSNPGAFLIFLTAVTFMGSLAGYPDEKGFFYLDNFGGSYWINNYLIAGTMLINTIVHWITVKLQQHR